MSNAAYAVMPLCGVNISKRSATADHALGTVVIGPDDNAWIYGKASEAVATGTCTVNTSTFAITDAAGNFTADTAFAINEFGWVRQTAKLLP